MIYPNYCFQQAVRNYGAIETDLRKRRLNKNKHLFLDVEMVTALEQEVHGRGTVIGAADLEGEQQLEHWRMSIIIER